jgi:hypothetical protein
MHSDLTPYILLAAFFMHQWTVYVFVPDQKKERFLTDEKV